MKPVTDLSDQELVAECQQIYDLPDWKKGFPLTPKQRQDLEKSVRIAELIGQRNEDGYLSPSEPRLP